MMAQNSNIEANADKIDVNDFIKDFNLSDMQADNQSHNSEIIDSSEKTRVLRSAKRKTRRNVGPKSKLLVGDILNEPPKSKLLVGDMLNKPYLKRASNLSLQLPQKPIANRLVEKTMSAFVETEFEEFDLRFASQLPPTVEQTLQTSLPKQPFGESSEMFKQPIVSPLRTTQMTNTHSNQLNPEQTFKRISNISGLDLSSPQRPVSESIHLSDSSDFTPRRYPNYLTDSQADQNSELLQLADIHDQLAVQNAFSADVLEQQRRWEGYIQEKLENLDQGICSIMETLRQEVRQIHYTVVRTGEHEEIPTLPISKQEDVILLNCGLRNSDFMETFVKQLSTVVNIFKNSTRRSVYSIMSKIFTLNLLVDYTWSGSENTYAKESFPFSSLDGILKVINQMLGRYSTGIEIENELKELLRCVPRLYCNVLKKYRKEK